MLMTNERGVHAEPPTPSGLVGTTIKVLSKTENWRDCVVTDCEVGGSGLRVHYEGYDAKWDEWIEHGSERLRLPPAAAKAAPAAAVAEAPAEKAKEAQLTPEQVTQELQKLPELAREVCSGNAAAVTVEAMKRIRKITSVEENPPITEILASGVLPRLVELLQQDGVPTLQHEAAWAITNIASGTTDQTQHVVDAGAIPIFCRLLRASPSDDVRDQSVWALGNLAGDNHTNRNAILQEGGCASLLLQLRRYGEAADLGAAAPAEPTPAVTNGSRLGMLRNAAWALSNLCRGKPEPPFELVRPAIGALARLVGPPHQEVNVDHDVLADACWSLSYLADGSNEKIQAVIDEDGLVARLVELLTLEEGSDAGGRVSHVQTPALRAVGQLVTGDNEQTQAVLDCEALLPALLRLLGNVKKGIRKEACWTLANVLAGSRPQIQQAIDQHVLPPVIRLLAEEGGQFCVRKEACWAISNAAIGGSPHQIKALVREGCVGALCSILSLWRTGRNDARIMMVALEGLESVLQVGRGEVRHGITEENEVAKLLDEEGGLEELEALQQHENSDVYEKARDIIVAHFDEDEARIELHPPHLRDPFYSTDPSETPEVVPAAEQPEGMGGGGGSDGGASVAAAVAAAPPAATAGGALASSLQRLSVGQDGDGDGGSSSSSSSSSSDDDGE
jgi:hypothetical protein